MWPCLNRRVATQIYKQFIREKPKSIFANGSVICDQSCNTYTQRVGKSGVFQLSTTFGICRTNRLIIVSLWS